MEKNRKPRGGKGGRPAKNDPAVYRFSVNFSAVEHARFLDLYEQSGLLSKAAFIKARVFNEAFRVVKTDRGTLLQDTADFREGIIQLPVDGRTGDHVIRAEALKGTPADAQVTADLLAVHPFVVYILLIPCTPLFRERGDCSLYFLYTPDKLVIGSRTDHYDFHTPLFFSLLQRSGLYGQLKTRSVRLFFDNLQ